MEFRKHSDNIIIIGKGGTRMMLPTLLDKLGEGTPIWTLNNGYSEVMSSTENLHFDAHDPERIDDATIINTFRKNSRNFNESKLKVVRRKDIPIEVLVSEFGTNFIKNCISYQIALATHLKYKHIYLLGVDTFVIEKTAAEERASVEFWIGVARGRGIKVSIPQKSSLFKNGSDWMKQNYANGMKIGEGNKLNDEYLNREDNLYR